MLTESTLDSICYKRNFLTEVITRIDLVSPLPNLEKELPKDISKVALVSFPIDEPKPAFTQDLIVSEKNIILKFGKLKLRHYYIR